MSRTYRFDKFVNFCTIVVSYLCIGLRQSSKTGAVKQIILVSVNSVLFTAGYMYILTAVDSVL